MSLTAGIVGLPNVGKSTLFNAITKSNALSANYPFATIDPNVGIVDVRDKRLLEIAKLVNPKQIVYAHFSFTDIAGLVKGASQGEGLGNQFLSHIREVDAIVHVVRCFENDDIIHVSGKIDPLEDIETINLELVFADLELIERRIPRVEKKAQFKVDHESVIEYQALQKLKTALQSGIPAREVDLTEEEIKLIKGYNLLTLKPMIYCLNVSEEDLIEKNKYVLKVEEYAKKTNTKTVMICAKIEEELSQLEDNEREEFLRDLGIIESGLDQLVRTTFDLLGLATFFTAGEKEVKAWTFKKGMTAQECAGIIHSDFARGFIRAEVTPYEELIRYGGMNKAREAGKMRLEGKEYLVQDGDIVLFRFNV